MARMEYITELRNTDVLLGRGSGPNDHEGNKRFRERVAERKQEYMATNHRLTKAKIAQEIVDSVFADNGRFLRRVEDKELQEFGIPEGTDAWVPASQETIMEKAKQALRQNSGKYKADAVASKPSKEYSGAPPAAEIQYHDYADLEPIPLPKGSYAQGQPTQALQAPAVAISPPPTIPAQLYHHERTISAPTAASSAYEQTNLHRYTSSLPPQQYPQQPLRYENQTSSLSIPFEEVSSRFDQVSTQALSSNTQISSLSSSLGLASRNTMSGADQSMAHIPLEDTIDRTIDNRRGSMTSMTMNELSTMHYKRGYSTELSADMSVLMDSFTKMKVPGGPEEGLTSPEARKKMFTSSSDTMGTIEPIGVNSLADMSVGTMNSSTFSIFKDSNINQDEKPDSCAAPAKEITMQRHEAPMMSRNEAPLSAYSGVPPLGAGMGHRVVSGEPGDHRKKGASALQSNPNNVIAEDSEFQRSLTEEPRPVILIEDQPDMINLDSLGQSSMSVLKAAFTSSTFASINDLEPSQEFGANNGEQHHKS